MSRRVLAAAVAAVLLAGSGDLRGQTPQAGADGEFLLRPARVFDGERIQEGHVVHVKGARMFPPRT